MDWNYNLRPPFVTLPDNNHLSFFYNYNYDPYQEMQTGGQAASMVAPTMMMDHHHHHHQNKNINYGNNNNNINNNQQQQQQEKKKQRLTSEQMESLEKSFQEEIKLDPDRKMKLAKELGMEPRQIAVWFQNRRARWRTKELERLYDALKLEYDAVSREKDKLQQEVVALRSVMKEQLGGGRIKAVSAGYNNNTEISGGEETVESTSIMQTSTTAITNNNLHHQHMPPGTYIDHYNSTVVLPSSAYWAAGLPTYH